MDEQNQRPNRTRLISSSIKEPQVFTGSSNQEAVRFVRRFELYSKSVGWDDDEKLEYIELFLDDKALNWYERNWKRFSSWKVFNNEIVEKFDKAESELFYWQELLRIKQGTKEELEEFIARMDRLFTKSKTEDEDVKLKCLLSAILPSYQKAILRSGVDKYGRDKDYEESEFREQHERYSKLEEDIRSLTRSFEALLANLNSREQSQTSRENQQGTDICFKCNGAGHYANNCQGEANNQQKLKQLNTMTVEEVDDRHWRKNTKT
ncbi:hypothetical protein AX774_g8240 [Zancudomyces culisetae]|uniref:CCHC-type domain-containing protein n=1 Tax=Zancudomyces culisetae TaxID=1213189 RepID=A0A1R1PBN3_ZANCU|nr:hypothetical protein AX774_g8240 [Zancudomyces culisetae]|eukprot:OMH78376.1 hypothetical protein AX774_g8240 [Zancudomyces culisetae]